MKSRWIRSLIDIVIAIAASFVIGAVVDRFIPFPADPRAQLLYEALPKFALFIVILLLLRFRDETPAVIGLKSPPNWTRAISLGLIVGIALFVIVFLLERAGVHRDLSVFAYLKGNIEMTICESIYVAIAAGFYEEFLFRGFLLQRLALVLGGNRVAWAIACVVQAIIFGSQHAYQNPTGMILTGGIGFALGVVFLNCGRNLWPLIIAHAFYDVARTIMFYFTGPPA